MALAGARLPLGEEQRFQKPRAYAGALPISPEKVGIGRYSQLKPIRFGINNKK